MVRVLSDADVAAILDFDDLLAVVEEAFRKQGRGAVERPDRPHFPVGRGLDPDPDGADRPLGTGLVMPAYIHGATYYATKLVGVHDGNTRKHLPTVNAQVALTDAATGLPVAYMAGSRITNARTGCIGGLAARELSEGPIELGIIGAGTQARWQTRTIAAACEVDAVRVYSPSDSKHGCATDLNAELDVPVDAVDSPATAVSGADVVVTATTSMTPVFAGDTLEAGTVVIAIGAYSAEMQELDTATMDRAARVFADVPEEAAETGDVLRTDVRASDLVAFSAVLDGGVGRTSLEEILVVESVGTAVLDAATAEYVLDAAEAAGIGTTVPL